jgi:predicted glycosyltransferase involved in capsule biosynthesis
MEIDVLLPNNIRVIWSPEKFSSAVANNRGAAVASTDILIFQDADIIFPNEYYDLLIEQIKSGFEATRVGEICSQYPRPVINDQMFDAEMKRLSQYNPIFRDAAHIPRGTRHAPGACQAYSRAGFIKIGGWCELFRVYGWEDCYQNVKVRNHLKHSSLNKFMLHLAHEENYEMKEQKKNRGFYQEVLDDSAACVERDRKFLQEKYALQ